MKSFLIPILALLTLSAMAQPFRCVVAADGTGTHTSLQAAINDCPDNERSIIFIKNGRYDEQISIGTNTVASLKKISLIGENADSVIITNSKFRTSTNGLSFYQIVTFQVYATDFYAENITIENTAGNVGMAEALFTGADRQTFKNCIIRSYQDTYRSKKGTRGYFKNSHIEGAVDFIYAGGVLFFDDCTIHCIGNSGYITAPEDAAFTIPKAQTVIDKFLRLGFIFRNCNITAADNVPAQSFYLGRPWNTMAGSFYINCTLGSHIHPKGWREWNGNETTASFGEYKSRNPQGSLIDVSQRVSWSFQLPEQDVNQLFTTEGIYARVSSTLYDPVSICIAPTNPPVINVQGQTISWEAVDGVAGYIILKNNRYLGATSTTQFTDTDVTNGEYSIRSVGMLGQLGSNAAVAAVPRNPEIIGKAIYANNQLQFPEPIRFQMYHLNGKLMQATTHFSDETQLTKNLPAGIYVLHMENQSRQQSRQKLIITP